jgi:hypothetical protein
MQARGWDRARLIDAADLSDALANRNRETLLGDVRGFGRGGALFQGFPLDTRWRRVVIELPDFHRPGRCTAAPILVEADGGALVIVEGHTRATAYALLSDRSFSAFIGTSSLVNQWFFV